jgi:hypothetical protein
MHAERKIYVGKHALKCKMLLRCGTLFIFLIVIFLQVILGLIYPNADDMGPTPPSHPPIHPAQRITGKTGAENNIATYFTEPHSFDHGFRFRITNHSLPAPATYCILFFGLLCSNAKFKDRYMFMRVRLQQEKLCGSGAGFVRILRCHFDDFGEKTGVSQTID